MKKIIVIGSSGYLGTAITDLASRTYPVIATYRTTPCPVYNSNTGHVRVDFEDQQSVIVILRLIQKTDIVIVASNVEYGSLNKTILCNYHGMLYTLQRDRIKTIFISSDAVFDGKEDKYAEDSVPNPITDYGKQKFKSERIIGERQNVIIRTSYIYGSNRYVVDKRFWEIENAAENDSTINKASNLIRNPIHVVDLAKVILLLKEKTGIFHVAGPRMSAYTFYHFLAKEAGIIVDIKEVMLKQEQANEIPLNTNLVSNKLRNLGIHIPSVKENSGRIYPGSTANYT
ncbi:RmlD substrate binding domain protein [Acididesulfobacillus acetoxydans]|nr:sugar nucleotide-binding protein [Acididesulfobacillus acetoxydans]CAA7599986.1 RmlD substrate binding domain protein [Acididesulfobacillus acetoxydans]CEJ05979.1 dTDP-4-dehydrorhamnose reductase [Acididesulfobacillus acetoxydans]